MVGAGAPHATFVPVDFLHGHMPPMAELNTGFYQAAQQGPDEAAVVPFVTRWAHGEDVLRRRGFREHGGEEVDTADGADVVAARA